MDDLQSITLVVMDCPGDCSGDFWQPKIAQIPVYYHYLTDSLQTVERIGVVLVEIIKKEIDQESRNRSQRVNIYDQRYALRMTTNENDNQRETEEIRRKLPIFQIVINYLAHERPEEVADLLERMGASQEDAAYLLRDRKGARINLRVDMISRIPLEPPAKHEIERIEIKRRKKVLDARY